MSLFVSGFLLGMSLVLDLGTGNVALIRTGATKGFKQAVVFALGCSLGDMIYIVLAVSGISLLLQANSIFQWALWIGGTAILLYLAWQSLRDAWRPKTVDFSKEIKDRSLVKTFLTGIALVLTAPTGLLWFATVGGSVVASTVSGVSTYTLYYFFAGFLSISLIWGVFLAYVSSVGGKLLGNNMMRGLSIVTTVLFIYFAVYVFLGGVKTLL